MNNSGGNGGYRPANNTGSAPSQQNYGNSYGGNNTYHGPSSQQPYYGQTAPQQTQMYHQPMSNTYQQMGQVPRPMNPPQALDSRGYGQHPQHQLSTQNRS